MTMIEKVGLAIARKLGEEEFYISKTWADELGRVAIEAMKTPAPDDAGESRSTDG